jgi:hypothetical protein
MIVSYAGSSIIVFSSTLEYFINLINLNYFNKTTSDPDPTSIYFGEIRAHRNTRGLIFKKYSMLSNSVVDPDPHGTAQIER